MIVTADHTTACRMKGHTADAVPLLIYPHPKGEINEKRFTEKEGLEGKKWVGRKVLDGTLFDD